LGRWRWFAYRCCAARGVSPSEGNSTVSSTAISRDVERDLARGVLNASEAESARLEIQRRLLAVDEVSQAGT
jgi:cytochrome c-type biogenesis protein CcmH/NrfG